MRIRFLHSISSADGWSHPPGKTVDFRDDVMAAKFVRSGIAVPVISDLEIAVPAPPERRTKKR
jgi:hypothetical protein